MRLSVGQKSRKTLSSILHNWVVIKLNGIPQKSAIVADEELGMVERWRGSFGREGVPVTRETVFGTVEIELKPYAPAAVQKVWTILRKPKEKQG